MAYSSIADPVVVESLRARLAQLTPDRPRQWGTMTPAEMLTHLADCHDMALGVRESREAPPPGPPRAVVKFVALYVPLTWPRGLKTLASVDPRRQGTPAAEFDRDRERVLLGLHAIAAQNGHALAPEHVAFGGMTRANWQRWAYLHADHHLRQFGL
jgi:hypothetical protein